MNDYDFRQYTLMLTIVKTMPQTVKELGKTISALESLLALLEEPDPKWVEDFQSEWWTLEEVFAHNVSIKKDHLTDQEREWVVEALGKLALLIQRKLKSVSHL